MAPKRRMAATQKQKRRERRRARVSLLRAASRHGEQIVVTGRAP